MKKLSNKKGFTLIEMLIVVAIMVILVAVAVPNFSNATAEAKYASTAATERNATMQTEVNKLLTEINNAK